MKLILLAAGKSNRIYKKLGKHKCLLKIRNKTLIEKIIDDARSCGLKKIDVIITFPKNYSNKIKKILKRTALNCPVHKSLSTKIIKDIKFIYN